MTTEQTTQDAAHMAEIGHLLRTQDNRATDVPIFIVQEQRRLYGLDPAYADDGGIVWLDCENDHAEVDAEEHARLEKLHDEGEDVPGKWTRTAYRDEWHFVTACFTEAGCNEYIRVNGHNHRGKLRVYAAGSWRNEEWRSVYRFLRQIGEAPGHVSIPRRTLEKLVDATRRNHDVREARDVARHVLHLDALRYEPARTDPLFARVIAEATQHDARLVPPAPDLSDLAAGKARGLVRSGASSADLLDRLTSEAIPRLAVEATAADPDRSRLRAAVSDAAGIVLAIATLRGAK